MAEKEAKEKAAKLTAAPGKVVIRYKWDHYSQDFGAPELHRQGSTLEVDAEKAKQLLTEYGSETRGKMYRPGKDPLPGDKITDLGCPFEIVSENKAMGEAPETK